MPNTSKLVRIAVRNIGCIGNEGLTVELDNIVCLVGKNNSGKSTILRAYCLAQGAESFVLDRDRCQAAPDEAPCEIELDVHIPTGIGNVDEKWKKKEGELLIVRSRWQWAAPNYEKVRTTWDPEKGDWSDENAGGAENVFKSRLPRPLRIGSLQDAESTEKSLVALALAPLQRLIEEERLRAGSQLSGALGSVLDNIAQLSTAHEKQFNEIAQKVTAGFQGVFPTMDVRLNVTPIPVQPKVESGLRVKDGGADTSIVQQGTGARRALFWAMLQVHNELTRTKESRDKYRKQLEADIKKAEKPKGKQGVDEDALNALKAQLAALDEGGPIPVDADDPALPGYLLLIDEPENALHPMAARAAQKHLYKLAESPDWQVMMTTHSPYFINPFEDHTTIVRLERDDKKGAVGPKTYHSDDITFEGDDKQRLQAMQHLDPSLAEIFFGSYPVLVEGDTEHAAFIAAMVEKQHELAAIVTVVRARGKAILPALISMLEHFKIDFGVVHDCDPPFKSDGSKNGMWTQNERIHEAVRKARKSGVTVRHRVSILDFERYLGYGEETKDKPITAYMAVKEDSQVSSRVEGLLKELLSSEQFEPFTKDELKDDAYVVVLNKKAQEWAKQNGAQDDLRFKGK